MSLTPSEHTTLLDLISRADENQINACHTALNARLTTIRNIRAATVTVGDTVMTTDIRPKYLAGLTGTVTMIQSNRATIALDQTSTQRLAMSSRKFSSLHNKTSHNLDGIPLACLIVKPSC